jgi:hypothetical protein
VVGRVASIIHSCFYPNFPQYFILWQDAGVTVSDPTKEFLKFCLFLSEYKYDYIVREKKKDFTKKQFLKICLFWS